MNRTVAFALALTLGWGLAAVLGAAVGSVSVPLDQVFAVVWGGPESAEEPAHGAIVWSLRLPRVALATLVGAALAAGGAALQGVFRNPLADPYVLGIASGGALGAASAMVLFTGLGLFGPVFGGFAGAFGAALVVHSLARSAGRLSVNAVLLAGVAVGLSCSAGVSLVLVLAETQATNVLIWLMGSVGGRGWSEVFWVAALTGVGIIPLLVQARALDAFALGEESASALGVHTERVKLTVFAAVALLVAAAVSFCGLIGFVGLIVPHGVRMLVGPGHRQLVVLSAIAGAFVLVSADLGARVLLADRELPIGVITGCLGGPFFLILLRRRFLDAGR